MIVNIRSRKTLNKIFSILDEKVKFKIVAYNKSLQAKLSINPINYKAISNKEVIQEKKDIFKIKSSLNDFIYYEGVYLNGKKHGKGKEYRTIDKDGKEHKYLEYEGEFKNGKRNGKGKKYDDDGDLIFKGEFKNGLRWNGKGKEYDKSQNLIFEGEFKNGLKWNGKCWKIAIGGIRKFECEFKNGIKFLEIEECDEHNLIYRKINEKKTKKKNKFGNLLILYEKTDYWRGIKFVKLYNPYEKIDNFGGMGKTIKIHRKTRIDLLNKLFLYDESENLIINECFNEEEIYTYEYLSKNTNNGNFEEYDQEGNLIFQGEYINGVKYGKEFDIHGNVVFKGEYFYGKRFNGRGKEFYSDGKLKFEGDYIMGVKKDKEYFINASNGNLILLDGIKSDNKNNNDNNFKGKEYDYRGNIIFEGDFSSRQRSKGKRKIYDSKNNFLFEIDYDKNSFSKTNKKILENNSIYKEDGNKIEKGKEINFENNSIFEGEFSKGEKLNGIIRIYNKLKIEENVEKNFNFNVLILESEFTNGEISGKGKEYNNSGQLIFEGEYLKGERNGNGKEYFKGKIYFEGEYKNNKRWNGIGKICNYDKNLKREIIFESKFINGKQYEKEIHYDKNRNIMLEIDFYDGKKEGKGKEYDSKGNIIFVGDYQNGIRNGQGIAFDIDKKKLFEGEYIKGKKWNGTEYNYHETLKFEQQYKNGDKIGKIIMKEFFKGKLIYEGDHLNRKRNGFGIEYNIKGGKFLGIFKNGKKWDGTGYNEKNEIDYDIINGNGIVKEYWNGKLIYIGKYENGKRHGKGKELDYLTGKIKYEGIFFYGKKFV